MNMDAGSLVLKDSANSLGGKPNQDSAPDLTSASSSPPSSLSDDSAHLEELRRQNEQKLQSRFQSIYTKYSHDFAGVTDEIDLVTGEVTVSHGHLKYMRHERDVGRIRDGSRYLSDEADQTAPDEPVSQPVTRSIASLINADPSNWSKPGAFDQYFSGIPKDRVEDLVQRTVKDQADAAEEPLADNESIHDSGADEEPDTVRWEPSIWEDADLNCSLSRSASPEPGGDFDTTPSRNRSRKGVARWTKDEDAWLISLKNSGTLTYREISRRFPNRSFRAVRSRFRALLRHDPALVDSTIATETCGDIDKRLEEKLAPYTNSDNSPLPSEEVTQSARSRAHFSSKRIWTMADDQLILRLREKDKLVWREIAHYFPGRSPDAVAWRYYFRLQKGAKRPVPQTDQGPASGADEENTVSETITESDKSHLAHDLEVSSKTNETGPATRQIDNDSDHQAHSPCERNEPVDERENESPLSSSNSHNIVTQHGSSRKRKKMSDEELDTHDISRDCATLVDCPAGGESSVPIDPMLLEQIEPSQHPNQPQMKLNDSRPEHIKVIEHVGPLSSSQTALEIRSPLLSDTEQGHSLLQNHHPVPNLAVTAGESSPDQPSTEMPCSPNTPTCLRTPSRQAQWSFADALAKSKDQYAETQSYDCASFLAKSALGNEDERGDDGLGSEDELGH